MTGTSTTRQDLRSPRAGFLLVAVALTLANVAAIVAPFEIYPFTSSPMFAHPPVGSGTRYLVDVRILTLSSGDYVFPYEAIGFTETHFLRTLLVRGYGSVDADAPYGFVRGDDDAARTRRLQGFFRACVDALRKRNALPGGITGIRLSLRAKDLEAPTREIGTYDLASGEFQRPGASR
jgi:hypothetical protein